MAASSTSSWLLSPSTQQQTPQHTLYAPELAIHQDSQHPGINSDPRQLCDGFCPPHQCPVNLDFQQTADSHHLPEFNGPAGGSCNGHVGLGDEGGGRVSARKVHKADREKLRRDRLNEQFAELAGVLDPDRPKNDKATILGDSVQVVRELRSEVKRLRTEHNSLLDESRDLAQEKIELREEKASLKCDTEHLQSQLQQRIRLMLPWMGMDPAMMMGAPPCGYPIPVAQPASAPPADMSQSRQQGSLQESSAASLPSYVPLAPTAPTSYALHPALQGYTMYANRPADGSVPYLPYPHYPSQISSHSHVERPFPQYPSPMHPVPGYLMQMQPHPGQPPMSGTPTAYQQYPASLPFMPPRAPGTQPNGQARATTVHPTAACGPDLAPQLQPQLNQSGSTTPLQTTLQLQTPLQTQTQQLSQANSKEGNDETTDAPVSNNGVVETPISGVQKETQPTPAGGRSPSSAVVNSTMVSQLMTGSAGICSPQVSSSKRESVMGHGGKDAGADGQKRGPLETHAAAVRPPAA